LSLPDLLYRCHVASRHFEFTSYGATPDTAREALCSGLVAHCAATGADFPTWGMDMLADATPQPIRVGACYRDDFDLLAAPR
jgi:hypothetical protein